MKLLGVSSIIEAVGQLADDLFTSDEERAQAQIELNRLGIEERRIDAGLARGQQQINQTEARHRSIFVAGWRPAVGWVCVSALGYQFLLYPLMQWIWAYAQARGWLPAELSAPPMLDTAALYSVLGGILGLGSLRTAEKVKGVTR